MPKVSEMKRSRITGYQVCQDEFDRMDEEEQAFLQDLAESVKALIAEGRMDEARKLASNDLWVEEQVALWSQLDSKQRSALKRKD